jgi:hypothetical protein
VPVRIELDCDRVRADLRAAAWATGLPHFAGAGQDVTAWIDAATEAELQLMDSLCHLARVVRLHEWAALTGGAEVLER